jgi:hypothetical protein
MQSGIAALQLLRPGLASVDLELPPARVDLRSCMHDLELASRVVELERQYGPDSVRAEREMRAAETPLGVTSTARPRFAVPLARASGSSSLRPPDTYDCTSQSAR